MMQSNRGVIRASTARRRPVQVVECGGRRGRGGGSPGPAVRCPEPDYRRHGRNHRQGLDCGGRAAVPGCRVRGRGRDQRRGGCSRVVGIRCGAGLDIAEVGAGGGSLVRVDTAVACGSVPRAAVRAVCYGLGNEQPTLTDANLVLGYLNQTHLLGGALPIDGVMAARRSLRRRSRPRSGWTRWRPPTVPTRSPFRTWCGWPGPSPPSAGAIPAAACRRSAATAWSTRRKSPTAARHRGDRAALAGTVQRVWAAGGRDAPGARPGPADAAGRARLQADLAAGSNLLKRRRWRPCVRRGTPRGHHPRPAVGPALPGSVLGAAGGSGGLQASLEEVSRGSVRGRARTDLRLRDGLERVEVVSFRVARRRGSGAAAGRAAPGRRRRRSGAYLAPSAAPSTLPVLDRGDLDRSPWPSADRGGVRRDDDRAAPAGPPGPVREHPSGR